MSNNDVAKRLPPPQPPYAIGTSAGLSTRNPKKKKPRFRSTHCGLCLLAQRGVLAWLPLLGPLFLLLLRRQTATAQAEAGRAKLEGGTSRDVCIKGRKEHGKGADVGGRVGGCGGARQGCFVYLQSNVCVSLRFAKGVAALIPFCFLPGGTRTTSPSPR